eukprot:TRINITY_DN29270_c0_g1_i1.p1 TRINITY_DN29270_c0_g1~~TRINITY_DN29270_c0_g1_i1.p1  ORF type:complete len:550 (+),score=56.22 TRINITY_DN29270_c0_g1_i1:168-1652(+)
MMKRVLREAQSRLTQSRVNPSDAHPIVDDADVVISVGKNGIGQTHDETDTAVDLPTFAVMVDQTDVVGSVVSVRLPGDWTDAAQAVNASNATSGNGHAESTFCTVIVRRPADCDRSAFSNMVGGCSSKSLWASSDLHHYLEVQFPLPTYSIDSAKAIAAVRDSGFTRRAEKQSFHGWLCVRGIGDVSANRAYAHVRATVTANGFVEPHLLGKLKYVRQPKIVFTNDLVRIGVRTFLNPGWHSEIHLSCENCTAGSRIALRPLTFDLACKSTRYVSVVTVAAAVRAGQMPMSVEMFPGSSVDSQLLDITRRRGANIIGIPTSCHVPKQGPCAGLLDKDSVLSVGMPLNRTEDDGGRDAFDGNRKSETFVMESHQRLPAKDHHAFRNHRLAICFYPDETMPDGWLVGFASVHSDANDTQVLVLSACFFFAILPVLCAFTALLHCNKCMRSRDHAHRRRLAVQLEQLSRDFEPPIAETRERESRASSRAVANSSLSF